MPADGRMRLAFIADPNSIHTRRWVGFFARRGHSVHLLEGYGVEVRDGLPEEVAVHRYRAFGPWRIPIVSSLQGRAPLRRLLGDLRPDVLHGHYITRYGWQTRLSGFHPYVITPWGSDVFVTPRSSLRARLWGRATLRGADLVTVLTEQMRDAVTRMGARPRRIATVRFGVDTRRFSPGPADPELVERLGLGGRPLLFSPRAARPLYRHDTVLDAVAGLDDAVVVMSGRNADPDYLAEVRARAARAGVGERLRIIDDIPEPELLALYRTADVVVSVPESDGFPSTVLEAMACGAPVVASDVPAVRSVLERFAPELIVPAGDASALAAALRRALALGGDGRAALAERMRRYAGEEADQETNMLKMERLYRRLAGGA
ncbi:MAG TPA: glycosyltransferase [Candidatus Limnocylindria bacterium]|nr:glycosyltransferase [Candidatus Limnocylindria bacterium]